MNQSVSLNLSDYCTSYPSDWPDSLKRVFERLRTAKPNRIRVRLTYRDGYNESGYFGRTTGNQMAPIIVHNSRSSGGTSVMSGLVRVSGSRKTDPVYWDLARDEPILFVMQS